MKKNTKPGVAYDDATKAKVKGLLKTMTNKAIMRKLGGFPTSHWIGRFRRSLKVPDVAPQKATPRPKAPAKAQKPAKAKQTARKRPAVAKVDTSVL